MYSSIGIGGGGPFVGVASVAAGVAVLPNTGDSKVLMVTSIASIAIGSIILLSTAVRFVAKKAYKA